ncbi:MAG: glycoside hydrolase family 97 protein [Ignavibacteria bacterium]|jgi:alpha-glucosidase
MTKINIAIIVLLFQSLFSSRLIAEDFNLFSPDKKVEIKVSISDKIEYSVFYNLEELIFPSALSITLDDGAVLGANPIVIDSKTNSVNNIIYPVVKQKREKIAENYNELKLKFEGNYALVFRAYNEGAAYRFETSFDDDIIVKSEEVNFKFAGRDVVYFPQEERFRSHNERLYKKSAVKDLELESFCSLPALAKKVDGTNILLTEADIDDFPGLWLEVSGDNTLSGIHPPAALKEKAKNDRTMIVVESADYIAETKGTRAFPWRIMAIAENDGDLILNELVYLLGKPCELEDVSWVKPGKVAWDWWSALNIYGVDFKSGVNTETYKYYIDFAAKYGIEYIILDEGWYELGDLSKINPDVNMKELLSYGEEKNVGIILWVVWKTLDDQLKETLDRFEKWGVKGIKVDFMQRDDQAMVNYYWKIAREAAKRKLLVNFHGSYKPDGIRRTYPNVITREGVRAMEYCKWDTSFIPGHEVTLPFIRMVAGPMDYTPGAMNNAQRKNYSPNPGRPMSMGTRCRQLAIYVVYESPLQMLSDTPSNYQREAECMQFLSPVPCVWDETKVLHAKAGEYIALARRNGSEWYVGAMTDENPREFEIDFSFLGEGGYTMESYEDGINADKYGSDYKKNESDIIKDNKIKIKLAPAGGWAARIYKK